jgi:hypothetical protein
MVIAGCGDDGTESTTRAAPTTAEVEAAVSEFRPSAKAIRCEPGQPGHYACTGELDGRDVTFDANVTGDTIGVTFGRGETTPSS